MRRTQHPLSSGRSGLVCMAGRNTRCRDRRAASIRSVGVMCVLKSVVEDGGGAGGRIWSGRWVRRVSAEEEEEEGSGAAVALGCAGAGGCGERGGGGSRRGFFG